jgi:carboxylesterase type B
MKQLNLFLLFIFLATGSLWSQVRYYDQVFDSYEFIPDVIYGNNISVLTGSPEPLDLDMDVYTPPTSDTATNRPVIIYAHTGTFGPQYFNRQITGGKRDSTIVEIAKRLTGMGYVVVSINYRLGWKDSAEEQDERTSTLPASRLQRCH